VLEEAERVLMWEGRVASRRVVVLAFDPERGDMARRAALPVMLDRAIRLAAAIPPPVLAGQERLSPPERMGPQARVRAPDGRLLGAAEVPSAGLLPGLWRLEGGSVSLPGEDAAGPLSVMVPAGDLEESDLRAPPPLPPARQGDADGEAGTRGRRALWPAIALLAGALMLAEGVSVSSQGAAPGRARRAPRVRAKGGAAGRRLARPSRRGAP
jgi:hypothetical protein